MLHSRSQVQAFVFILLLGCAISSAQTETDFTVIALPDTQHYSEGNPQIFNSQTKWIAENAARLNIKFVLGLGDIVNKGESVTQWQNADAAVRLLDNAGIPYVLPPGNHDYMYSKPSTRDARLFNDYFGTGRYSGRSWYRGSYPAGTNENFYTVFPVNGKQYLVLALEFMPRDHVLSWASSVLTANQDKEVIMITHSYMYIDDSRIGRCDHASAEGMGVGGDNDGDEMWAKFVSRHRNIFLVLNGHSHGTGRRADLGVNGNLVNQVLADYQNETNGGNGWLRIMKFRPSLNRIEVTTYSPYLNQYRTDSRNQFYLQYKGGSSGSAGSIDGRVRTSSCTPVSGATVSVAGATAKTDSSGLYRLSAAAPNRYSVSSSAPNLQTLSQMVDVKPGYSTMADFFLGTASTPSTGTCITSTSAASITVCSPGSGSTITSPIRVSAAAYSPNSIRIMNAWVDGVKKYEVSGSKMESSIAVTAGTHRLSVLGVEPSGAFYKREISFTVSAASTSCTTGTTAASVKICTPGSGATVSSPAHITAAAFSPNSITRMEVWIDGVKQYQAAGSRLDAAISAAPGARRLSVVAVEPSGTTYKQTIYFSAQ